MSIDIKDIPIDQIPYIIPEDWNQKKNIALKLERAIISYINKSGLNPVDALFEFLDKYNIRYDDIEDYILLMNTYVDFVKNSKEEKVKKTLF